VKAHEWMKFMEEQRREHGKSAFSVTELANAGDTSLHSLNTELGRLVSRGMIVRYAHGRYGLPGGVTPEDLVSVLDNNAYVTGAYALYRHNLITQIPSQITCFTNRRHNRSRAKTTAAGVLVFVRVSQDVYSMPEQGNLAGPVQALYDLVYMLRREGLRPESLFTFRHLDRIRDTDQLPVKYPDTVRKAVSSLLRK
jgi:hypothetical protein